MHHVQYTQHNGVVIATFFIATVTTTRTLVITDFQNLHIIF